MMKLCRFLHADGTPRVGLLNGEATRVADLSSAGVTRLDAVLEDPNRAAAVQELARQALPSFPIGEARLLSPVDRQEVWAAGVTYIRSKAARMEESEFSASAYDRVYDAARPELFFKSMPEKVVGPGEPVGIRGDARWNVPEPELTLVLTSQGEIAGYTIGNDMSSRDIEGENLLYLPQAKVYDRSCAVGPCVVIGASEEEARLWSIQLEIRRETKVAFEGETSVHQIKRSFQDLKEHLFRSQRFPHGAMLLTGTGVVPGEDFSLRPGDEVAITISGVGRLTNPVASV